MMHGMVKHGRRASLQSSLGAVGGVKCAPDAGNRRHSYWTLGDASRLQLPDVQPVILPDEAQRPVGVMGQPPQGDTSLLSRHVAGIGEAQPAGRLKTGRVASGSMQRGVNSGKSRRRTELTVLVPQGGGGSIPHASGAESPSALKPRAGWVAEGEAGQSAAQNYPAWSPSTNRALGAGGRRN
eukprot:jgi/Mesvir1/24329/Mv11012-RA.1